MVTNLISFKLTISVNIIINSSLKRKIILLVIVDVIMEKCTRLIKKIILHIK